MKDFIRFRNRIAIASAFLVAATALVLLHFRLPEIAFGVMLGGTGSIAKLWLSSIRILKFASTEGQTRASVGGKVRAAMTGYMFRYGLIAVVLAVGFLVEQVNFIAAAAALFTTNVVLIGSEVLRTFFPGGLSATFGRVRSRVGDA